MNKFLKKLLLIGSLFFVVGILIAFFAFASVGFNVYKLSGTQFETKNANIPDGADIEKIVLSLRESDVTIEFCDTEKISITYQIKLIKKGELLIDVEEKIENGVFSLTETRNWKKSLAFFNIGSPKVNIKIPKDMKMTLDVTTNTGDVLIKDKLVATSDSIVTNTGDITLESSLFTSLNIEKDTGDACLNNVTVTADTSIKTHTGDNILSNFRSNTLNITSNTGETILDEVTCSETFNAFANTGDITLKGTLISPTVKIKTNTGDVIKKDGVVRSPKISITTSTGDVKLTIDGSYDEYTVTLDLDTGSSNIEEKVVNTDYSLNFTSHTGDGNFNFTK